MCAIKIGWAKRDISTTEPVSINGQAYMRISEGIHDPIMVTALCIDGGEGQDAAVFVTCDLNGMREPIVTMTKQKVAAADPRIPVENIVIGVTHTHAAPAPFATPQTTPDGQPIYSGEAYLDFCTDQICAAVCEAWNDRAEGGIAYGYSYAVVGHSRRVIYTEDQSKAKPNSIAPNGFGVMYGRTSKPTFSHYEAGADHFLNVMFTVDDAKKLTGMVINVPCPSQTSEHFKKLSADYWNEVRQAVAAEYGPDVYVLCQPAAAGDLAPRTLHYMHAQARRMELKYGMGYDPGACRPGTDSDYNKAMTERRDIAQRILDGVRDVYSWAMKDIQTEIPVRHVAARVPLTRRIITDEEKQWCQDNIEKMKALAAGVDKGNAEEYRASMSTYEWVKKRNLLAIERYEQQKTEPTISYSIHITQVGPIAFAANPFEMYQDFMHRIQARSPFIQTFVVQMAGDDYAGYLPTCRAAKNKGYSASIFCNRVGPEGGQELVEYTLSVLNRMKTADE